MALSVTLSTDRESYRPGDAVRARMLVQAGPDSVTLEFSSGQRYDFSLLDGDRVIWHWSADKAFMMMVGTETIAPGGSLEYEEEFPAPARPGRYRLVGTITAIGQDLRDTVDLMVR